MKVNTNSIVVLGRMNPAIHHPAWYGAVDILRADEVEAAVAAREIVLVPQLAKFQSAGFGLQCTDEQWQVSTDDAALVSRILDIACGTFARLKDTPVSAFGVNTHMRFKPDEASIREALGGFIASLPVGLVAAPSPPIFSQLNVAYSLSDLHVEGGVAFSRTMNASIRAVGDTELIAGANIDHRLAKTDIPREFHLEHVLRAAEPVRAEAEKLLEGVRAAINAVGK